MESRKSQILRVPWLMTSLGIRLFSLICSCGRRVIGMFKRPGADNRPDWKNVLRKSVDQVEDLNRSTEGQFLMLGSKLQSFYQDVKAISKMTEAVADLMSGDRITSAIDGLSNVLARVEYLESESQRYAVMLKHILETLDKVSLSLADFQKFVQKLNVFCTTTRIESARLGDSNIGFDTLADDIKKLAGNIESKSCNILGRLDTLRSLIRQNLSNVLQAEARQRGQTRTILDRTRSSLTSLTEKRELSLSTARHITSCYTDLSRLIGEIVASMQFHDITRQQIEHVAQALRVLSEAAPAACEPSNLSDVCEIQAIQLRHAAQKLTTAVHEILANLRAVAEKISDMTHESLEITAGSDGAGNSFLCSMEDQLSHISSTLYEYGEANHDVINAKNSIAGAIQDISTFVSEIERTGVAIKLIALNAIVKAAHIGEKGAALGVLADAIHHLSFDTDQQTRFIADTFKSITVSAEQLTTGADSEEGQFEETADRMAVNLKTYKSTLGEANENIVSQLAAMDKAEKDLLEDMEITTAGISVHDTVAGVSAHVASELESMVTEWRVLEPPLSGQGNEEKKAELLRALEASYTMNSERQVHQSVTISRAPESSEGIEAPQLEGKGSDGAGEDKAEDEFGDNVELF